jgi:hypothetical protein
MHQDDWYVVYANATTHLIEKYIVTAKAEKKKPKKLHAIQYLEYTTIDGIPIAKWVFLGMARRQRILQMR